MEENKKFKSLKTSLKIYKFYAWLLLHLSIVIALLILIFSSIIEPLPTIELGSYVISLDILNDRNAAFLAAGVTILLGSLFYIRIQLRSKTMLIFLAIEENTRLNTALLTNIENLLDTLTYKKEEENLK